MVSPSVINQRKPHFVERAKSDQQPPRLVVLDADLADDPIGSSATARLARLLRWCARGWDRPAGRLPREWAQGGDTPASLFDTWRWATRQSGLTWVVSWQAARLWGAAGLWELLETRKVLLDGRSISSPASHCAPHLRVQPLQGVLQPGDRLGAAPGRGLSRLRAAGPCASGDQRSPRGTNSCQRGWIALDDPPTCLTVSLPGRPGRLMLLDARNWGLLGYPDTAPLQERVDWLYGVVGRMVDFLQREGWGQLKATSGSQALFTFRRAFLTHAVYCHDDPVASCLEAAAYVGGRCEAARLGHVAGPIYHFDVRSLYPHVCLQSLPSLLLEVGSGRLPDLRSHSPGCESGVIAQVAIETGEAAYPRKARSQTTYPVGRYRTVLAGPELDDALRLGRVASVGLWARYALTPVFAAYARAMYTAIARARSAGDVPLLAWLKRLAVSLPGKMGQRGFEWQHDPRVHAMHPWHLWAHRSIDGGVERRRALAGYVQCERRPSWAHAGVLPELVQAGITDTTCPGWAYDASAAIAVWVCSEGRRRLLEYIRVAGWEEVYYYDTDSLFCSQCGADRLHAAGLVDESAWGALRTLGCYPHMVIHGQKQYDAGDRSVCAGRSQASGAGSPASLTVPVSLGPLHAIYSGRRPEPVTVERPFWPRCRYLAGVVGPAGRISPFVCEEF